MNPLSMDEATIKVAPQLSMDEAEFRSPTSKPATLGKKNWRDGFRDIRDNKVSYLPYVNLWDVKTAADRLMDTYAVRDGTADEETRQRHATWLADQQRETTFGFDVVTGAARLVSFGIEIATGAGLFKKIGQKIATSAIRKGVKKGLAEVGEQAAVKASQAGATTLAATLSQEAAEEASEQALRAGTSVAAKRAAAQAAAEQAAQSAPAVFGRRLQGAGMEAFREFAEQAPRIYLKGRADAITGSANALARQKMKALALEAGKEAALFGALYPLVPGGGLGNMLEDFVNNLQPDQGLTEDDKGNLTAFISDERISPLGALAQAYASGAIEAGSEQIGTQFKVLKAIAGWDADKFAKMAVIQKLQQAAAGKPWLARLGRAYRLAEKQGRKFGWDGIAEEMYEERVGDLMRTMIGQQSVLDTLGAYRPGRLLTEAAIFAVNPLIAVRAGHNAVLDRVAGEDQMENLRKAANLYAEKEYVADRATWKKHIGDVLQVIKTERASPWWIGKKWLERLMGTELRSGTMAETLTTLQMGELKTIYDAAEQAKPGSGEESVLNALVETRGILVTETPEEAEEVRRQVDAGMLERTQYVLKDGDKKRRIVAGKMRSTLTEADINNWAKLGVHFLLDAKDVEGITRLSVPLSAETVRNSIGPDGNPVPDALEAIKDAFPGLGEVEAVERLGLLRSIHDTRPTDGRPENLYLTSRIIRLGTFDQLSDLGYTIEDNHRYFDREGKRYAMLDRGANSNQHEIFIGRDAETRDIVEEVIESRWRDRQGRIGISPAMAIWEKSIRKRAAEALEKARKDPNVDRSTIAELTMLTGGKTTGVNHEVLSKAYQHQFLNNDMFDQDSTYHPILLQVTAVPIEVAEEIKAENERKIGKAFQDKVQQLTGWKETVTIDNTGELQYAAVEALDKGEKGAGRKAKVLLEAGKVGRKKTEQDRINQVMAIPVTTKEGRKRMIAEIRKLATEGISFSLRDLLYTEEADALSKTAAGRGYLSNILRRSALKDPGTPDWIKENALDIGLNATLAGRMPEGDIDTARMVLGREGFKTVDAITKGFDAWAADPKNASKLDTPAGKTTREAVDMIRALPRKAIEGARNYIAKALEEAEADDDTPDLGAARIEPLSRSGKGRAIYKNVYDPSQANLIERQEVINALRDAGLEGLELYEQDLESVGNLLDALGARGAGYQTEDDEEETTAVVLPEGASDRAEDLANLRIGNPEAFTQAAALDIVEELIAMDGRSYSALLRRWATSIEENIADAEAEIKRLGTLLDENAHNKAAVTRYNKLLGDYARRLAIAKRRKLTMANAMANRKKGDRSNAESVEALVALIAEDINKAEIGMKRKPVEHEYASRSGTRTPAGGAAFMFPDDVGALGAGMFDSEAAEEGEDGPGAAEGVDVAKPDLETGESQNRVKPRGLKTERPAIQEPMWTPWGPQVRRVRTEAEIAARLDEVKAELLLAGYLEYTPEFNAEMELAENHLRETMAVTYETQPEDEMKKVVFLGNNPYVARQLMKKLDRKRMEIVAPSPYVGLDDESWGPSQLQANLDKAKARRDMATQRKQRTNEGGYVPAGLEGDLRYPASLEEMSLMEGWSPKYLARYMKGQEAIQFQYEYIGESLPAGARYVAVGGMSFAYRDEARDESWPATTAEAIRMGMRTATTRLKKDKGFEKWQNLKVGDIIKFLDENEDPLYVRVTVPAYNPRLTIDWQGEEIGRTQKEIDNATATVTELIAKANRLGADYGKAKTAEDRETIIKQIAALNKEAVRIRKEVLQQRERFDAGIIPMGEKGANEGAIGQLHAANATTAAMHDPDGFIIFTNGKAEVELRFPGGRLAEWAYYGGQYPKLAGESKVAASSNLTVPFVPTFYPGAPIENRMALNEEARIAMEKEVTDAAAEMASPMLAREIERRIDYQIRTDPDMEKAFEKLVAANQGEEIEDREAEYMARSELRRLLTRHVNGYPVSQDSDIAKAVHKAWREMASPNPDDLKVNGLINLRELLGDNPDPDRIVVGEEVKARNIVKAWEKMADRMSQAYNVIRRERGGAGQAATPRAFTVEEVKTLGPAGIMAEALKDLPTPTATASDEGPFRPTYPVYVERLLGMSEIRDDQAVADVLKAKNPFVELATELKAWMQLNGIRNLAVAYYDYQDPLTGEVNREANQLIVENFVAAIQNAINAPVVDKTGEPTQKFARTNSAMEQAYKYIDSAHFDINRTLKQFGVDVVREMLEAKRAELISKPNWKWVIDAQIRIEGHFKALELMGTGAARGQAGEKVRIVHGNARGADFMGSVFAAAAAMVAGKADQIKVVGITHSTHKGKQVNNPEGTPLATPLVRLPDVELQKYWKMLWDAAIFLGREAALENTKAPGYQETVRLLSRNMAMLDAPTDALFAVGHIIQPGEAQLEPEKLQDGSIRMIGTGKPDVFDNPFRMSMIRTRYINRQPHPVVGGGTAWGVAAAINKGLPVHVHDQLQDGWFTWDYEKKTFVAEDTPAITASPMIAGSRDLAPSGERALAELFGKAYGVNPRLVHKAGMALILNGADGVAEVVEKQAAQPTRDLSHSLGEQLEPYKPEDLIKDTAGRFIQLPWNIGALPDENSRLIRFQSNLAGFKGSVDSKRAQLFELGKKGNRKAAADFAADAIPVNNPEFLALAKAHPKAILQPIFALDDAISVNFIPQAMAERLSQKTKLTVGRDIVQATRAKHREKGAAQRMLAPVRFAGEVVPGGEYILVDDVTTTGQALASLRAHIMGNGGKVIAIVAGAKQPAMIHASQMAISNDINGWNYLAPQKELIDHLLTKGTADEWNSILRQYEIASRLEALTQHQAAYLVAFGGPGSFRARLAREVATRIGAGDRAGADGSTPVTPGPERDLTERGVKSLKKAAADKGKKKTRPPAARTAPAQESAPEEPISIEDAPLLDEEDQPDTMGTTPREVMLGLRRMEEFTTLVNSLGMMGINDRLMEIRLDTARKIGVRKHKDILRSRNWRKALGILDTRKTDPEHLVRVTELLEAIAAHNDGSDLVVKNRGKMVGRLVYRKGMTDPVFMDIQKLREKGFFDDPEAPEFRGWNQYAVEGSKVADLFAAWNEYAAGKNMPTAEALAAEMKEAFKDNLTFSNNWFKSVTDEEFMGAVESYMPHFYKGNEEKETYISYLQTSSSRQKQRTFPTYQEAAKFGYMPRDLNAITLFDWWSHGVWNTESRRIIIEQLPGFILDGDTPVFYFEHVEPTGTMLTEESQRQAAAAANQVLNLAIHKKLLPEDAKPEDLTPKVLDAMGYVETRSKLKGVRGIWALKDTIGPQVVSDLFDSPPAWMKPIRRLNAWSKAMMLFLSGFHPFAMAESFIAAYGNTIENPIFHPGRTAGELKTIYGQYITDPDVADPWLAAGLDIHAEDPNISKGLIDADIAAFKAWIDSKEMGQIKETLTKGFNAFDTLYRGWNKFLWNVVQPTMTLMVAERAYAELKGRMADQKINVPDWYLRQNIAHYVNSSMGGLDWNRLVWATPKVKEWIHLLVFAPVWTIGAADIAGVTRLPGLRKFFPRHSWIFKDQAMRLYWPAMLGLVLVGIPNALQAALYAAFGDPDEGDVPFTFLNEEQRQTSVDMTPLLRKFDWIPGIGYTGAPTGRRRTYMRWGKQAWEIADWFEKPSATALNKSSTMVRWAIEQTLSTSTAGWQMPFADMGMAGVLDSTQGFMGSRVGTTLQKFMPATLVAAMTGRPIGFFAPTSRGIGEGAVVESMRDRLLDWAEGEQYATSPDAVIATLKEGATRNGYNGDMLAEDARRRALGVLYRRLFVALETDRPIVGLVKAIVKLGGKPDSVAASIEARKKRYGLPASGADEAIASLFTTG